MAFTRFIRSSVFMNKDATNECGYGVIDIHYSEDIVRFMTHEYVERCKRHFYMLSDSKKTIDEIREWIIEKYNDHDDVQVYKNGRDILLDCNFHIEIKCPPDSDISVYYDIYGSGIWGFPYEDENEIIMHVTNESIKLMYDETYYGEFDKEIKIKEN